MVAAAPCCGAVRRNGSGGSFQRTPQNSTRESFGIHRTGRIAAFRDSRATQLVPCHSGVRDAQGGGGGASLRCHGAEWEGGNFSTHAAKLYA